MTRATYLLRGFGGRGTSYGMDEAAASIPGAIVRGWPDEARTADDIALAWRAGRVTEVRLGGNSMGATAALDVAARIDPIPVAELVLLDMHLPRHLPANVRRCISVLSGKNLALVKPFYHPSPPAGGAKPGQLETMTLDGVPSHSELDDDPRAQAILIERLGGQTPSGEPQMKPFYIGPYKPLTDADFVAVAADSGIPEHLLRAVVEVESAGKGQHTSGAVVARYEPHIAWKYSDGATRSQLANEDLAYQRFKSGYPKGSPYPLIDRAAEIAGKELAALATSWGLGQVMGFNHEALGYENALAMVEAFAGGEAAQLAGMVSFIRHAKLLDALLAQDWKAFARGYNGPAYAKNAYDTKLEAAAARWKAKPGTVKPPATLPDAGQTVILAFGSNDWGEPTAAAFALAEAIGSVKLRKLTPVYVPPNGENPKLAEVAQACLTVARETGAAIEAVRDWAGDGVHPSATGYDRIVANHPGALVFGDSFGEGIIAAQQHADPRSWGRQSARSAEVLAQLLARLPWQAPAPEPLPDPEQPQIEITLDGLRNYETAQLLDYVARAADLITKSAAVLAERGAQPAPQPVLPQSATKGDGSMSKIMEGLDGKKTYIIAFIVVAIGVAEGGMGWDVPGVEVGEDWLGWVLTGLGIGTFRDALRKFTA